MTEDLRTELIIAIQNNIGPWVALDGFTLFGNQVLAHIENMDDNQLINAAIQLNIITEEEGFYIH